MIPQKLTLPLLFLLPLLVVLALLGALHTPTNAAPDGTITVNTLADNESDGCGTNNCTLREAIADAVAGDVINFSTSGTIDISSNGQLIIDKDLTINGGNTIIVSGGNTARVFKIIGGNVTLDSLTITNGHDQSTDCYGSSCGGGVSVQGSGVVITISNSVVRDSVAGRGGGIHNGGNYSNYDSKLIVNNSVVSGNSTVLTRTVGGGGVSNSGVIVFNNSIISNNSTGLLGGGILNFGGDSTIEINDTTIIGNSADSNGGGIYVEGITISITNSTLTDNSASYGGGIYNAGGTFIIDNTAFSGNIATIFGGSIYNTMSSSSSSGRVVLSNSVMSGNSAILGGCFYSHTYSPSYDAITISSSTLSNNAGGCIYNAGGRMTINNSTISENWGNGGITNNSLIIIGNSTISGNSAGYYGGGIDNGGTALISNSTITNNRAEALGGGIVSDSHVDAHTVITNTIVSGNYISTTMLPDDLALDDGSIDSFVSGGYNLIGTIGMSITAFVDGVNGDQTGINNPRLSVLADHGGPMTSSGQATFTHALLPGSLAIDSGANCGTVDQRGISRPRDGDGNGSFICDVGAYENDIVYDNFIFLPVIVR